MSLLRMPTSKGGDTGATQQKSKMIKAVVGRNRPWVGVSTIQQEI